MRKLIIIILNVGGVTSIDRTLRIIGTLSDGQIGTGPDEGNNNNNGGMIVTRVQATSYVTTHTAMRHLSIGRETHIIQYITSKAAKARM